MRAALLTTVLLLSPAVSAGPPVLVAADAQEARLLRLDPVTGAGAVIGPLGNSTIAALAWDSHRGILFATSTATNQLLRVDPQTGASTPVGSLVTGCCMHGLEYSPTDGTLYGVLSGGPIPRIYRVNAFTGAASLVSATPLSFGSLAYDPALPAGVMYGSAVIGQEFRTVTLANGASTLIGLFGVPGAPFVQIGVGLAFHPAMGLYATDNGGLPGPPDNLYRIDTATGQATLIGETGGSNMLGLAFVGDACYGDCNSDGARTVADFGCFQTRFVAGSAYADCNDDGGLTVADFGCFQTSFVGGCP